MSWPPVADLAGQVRRGDRTAVSVAEEALARIAARDRQVGAFTRILRERAIAEASAVDAAVVAGRDPGRLAGVPYAVKDLFDVAGLPTTAGAAMREGAAAAQEDAEAVRRLRVAGAVLVGTCNMDEYAYGFATVNARWGTTRNPHDLRRLAGGSSGGSAAAVAGGMVPFALGSDTNGSVRVPASLCGVWGLKPTHGGLPMEGVFPFVDSLDDVGPFARSADDLELVYDLLSGTGTAENVPPTKVAWLGGWFARNASPELQAALQPLRAAICDAEVTIADVASARSAAFLMTAAEGGWRHLDALRSDPLGFDPATRDRLLAGAALPAAAYLDALRFRALFRQKVDQAFGEHEVLVAPATPCPAPLIDDPIVVVDGQAVPARANLGLYTQPLSFVGLPVVAAPLAAAELPIGVQLVGRPGAERALFAFARRLERESLLVASTK